MSYILPPFYGANNTRSSEEKRKDTLGLRVHYIGVDVFCYGREAPQSNYGEPIIADTSSFVQTIAFFSKLHPSDYDRGDI